jgi:hypothetical protein
LCNEWIDISQSKTTCEGIHNVETSQRHIEFDRNGTPCGDNASKFTSFISMIERDWMSCTLKEYVSDLKDKMWTEIKVII